MWGAENIHAFPLQFLGVNNQTPQFNFQWNPPSRTTSHLGWGHSSRRLSTTKSVLSNILPITLHVPPYNKLYLCRKCFMHTHIHKRDENLVRRCGIGRLQTRECGVAVTKPTICGWGTTLIMSSTRTPICYMIEMLECFKSKTDAVIWVLNSSR